MKNITFWCCLVCAIFFKETETIAQSKSTKRLILKPQTDTSFVKPYENEITARFYLSQKYTSIRVSGTSNIASFRYRPNTTLNLGVGATYRSFSLNLAYGFPGLNGDGSERGKTRYLDMQAHLYGRKLVIDFFGQFYKGYYVSPENYLAGHPGFYIRPDLNVRMVGSSAYYVFNHKKFSYRAGLIQNEWQTKSAGTFLLGAEAYYGTIKGDSTIVPVELATQFPQGIVDRMRFINIGPGAGYAYTFVYKRNWFITGSLTINVPLDFVKENAYTGDKNRITVSPNFLSRFAIGYNSRRWIYTASIVNGTVTVKGSYNENAYSIRTGNYRFTVARRITLTRKGKKIMQPIDKILEVPKEIGK